MRIKYRDIPALGCFSYGGHRFEKQSGAWSRRDPDGPLVWFHDEDEVFDEIPVSWHDGKPKYASQTTEYESQGTPDSNPASKEPEA